jgi:hypothetical protein
LALNQPYRFCHSSVFLIKKFDRFQFFQKEKNMPPIVLDIFSFLGFLLRAFGFLLFGFGGGRFMLDAYQKANWQLQIALALGFFGLLIGLTDFSSPGSAGAFALGAGIAFLMSGMAKKDASEEDVKKK